MLINILLILIVLELYMVWWLSYYEDSFFNVLYGIRFYALVLAGWFGYLCFAKSSVVTEIENGIIIKQIYIGEQ